MKKRIACRFTGLLLGTGLLVFAGGPGDCAAQIRTEPDQKRQSLSAAIEEARRSPFHAGADVGEPAKTLRVPTGIDIALAAAVLHQGAPQVVDSISGSIVRGTLIVAGLSHLAATVMFWGCALGEFGVAGCFLAPVVPLVATPLPALRAGADSRRAFGASLVGLLFGGAAYFGALMVTESISNVNPLVATVASSLVHAGITTHMLR